MEPKIEHLYINSERGQEAHIRFGKLADPLPLRESKKIELTGDINAVRNYLAQRYAGPVGSGLQQVDATKAIVITDKAASTPSITLMLDPENALGTVVVAKLEKDPDFLKARINSDEPSFGRQDFVKYLRFNKRFFTSLEEHTTLLACLNKLAVASNETLNASNDTRGNKAVSFDKKVEWEGPKTIRMKIPVYKGTDALTFECGIVLDYVNGSAAFGFDSESLPQLIDEMTEKIFIDQLAACADFPIIHK